MATAIKALILEESVRTKEESVYGFDSIAKIYGTSVEIEARDIVVHLSLENLLDLLRMISIKKVPLPVDYSAYFDNIPNPIR